jgi:coproporphyrinogen III oxidase
MKNKFYKYIENLQDQITSKIEALDGLATFEEDIWKRERWRGKNTCN